MSSLANFAKQHKNQKPVKLTLGEYLDLCKADSFTFATAPERMLAAIGEPEVIDTRDDARLSRIFTNRKIKRYPAFADFYGMEEAIEKIVAYYRHAAQGLEERKQILYLLGPVGGGKSSLAEKLKSLMEKFPIYVLVDKDGNTSPVFESPLSLFNNAGGIELLESEYGIPGRYIKGHLPSPWLVKRLEEVDGDVTQFSVVKLQPSALKQIGITKTEPGDENNQDISTLVGKVDIRKLEDFSQDDADAYSWKGGLNIANQGVLEFVEMFKAPIKMLHPLLTATQEGNYNSTEGIGAIPFTGMVLAHSNESEWESFKNDKTNEAFIDRVYIVKVPYCLRVTEEAEIYKKLLASSQLSKAPCAPHTLELLAQFSVLSRLKEPENSHLASKMRIYDGQNIRDIDPRAKSLQEYQDGAGVDEGMSGSSTRFAYKILSKTFNFDDSGEVAANPVHLMYVLGEAIRQEQLDPATTEHYEQIIKGILAPNYAEKIGKELQNAFIENSAEYAQNMFERYVMYADHWIQHQDYRDRDTGEMYDREVLNAECEKIEKAAGISNPKDFRNEVVNFVLREKANRQGVHPEWQSYEKMRSVIEKNIFSRTEDLMPVIAFNRKENSEAQRTHEAFVNRMIERGYTRKQVQLLVDWFMRFNKNR